ncbi:MAG: UDP-N-acetylmuramoyl-L-alanyl-D-glutamate--2,6-diaminopimelate ligase, partial [Oscillospiraceae bacterium]|nr:UDP-N-acetylmuramoyl-L-alanyl-D-glutamate--2,6-diaminopimelate ligase [Oscillospiraceae bacterium]
MKLSRLFSAIGADCPQDADITALACRSQETIPGALFTALEGAHADGRAYIPDALARGAAAV